MTIQQAFDFAVQAHRAGDLAEAESICRQILQYDANNPAALGLLSRIARQRGRSKEAADFARRAAAGHLAIAAALIGQRNPTEAAEACRTAIQLDDSSAQAHQALGVALQEMGDVPAAIAEYRRALSLRPDFVEALNGLGSAINRDGLDEAIAAYRRALELQPDYQPAHYNLGNALMDTGELDEAIAEYRRAAAIAPNPRVDANLLFALHFHPDCDPPRLWEEHVRWNQAHARPLASSIRPHENDRSPNRRLRIGYVSPDFRRHPVGRFLVPLLANHDHRNFEIVCYSDVKNPDSMTARLRGFANTWRETRGLSDEDLAKLIRQDRIDILVDLAMHTEGTRLLAFARKPAPVQVTYLAYSSTTGLDTMDYRLTDPWLDPPPGDDRFYSEKSARLPRTYWCYPPPEGAPPVGPPPCLAGGHVTFGCLNNFRKVNPATLAMWIKILRAVPNSRLILHSYEGSHRQRTKDLLAREGIDPSRLEFVGRLLLRPYLEQYNRIDVALDPHPYPGGTTTCDALWMGVPVVSMAGATALSRAGLSILANIGMPELAARTKEQYVQITVDLAVDSQRLARIRAGLRERMSSSALMDAPQFARNVEAAFRHMWQTWCDARAV